MLGCVYVKEKQVLVGQNRGAGGAKSARFGFKIDFLEVFCFGTGFKMERALQSETLAGKRFWEQQGNFSSENPYSPLGRAVLRNFLAGLSAVGYGDRDLTPGAFARNCADGIAPQRAQVGTNDLDGAVWTLHTGSVPQDDLLGQFRSFQQIGHVHVEFSQHAIG